MLNSFDRFLPKHVQQLLHVAPNKFVNTAIQWCNFGTRCMALFVCEPYTCVISHTLERLGHRGERQCTSSLPCFTEDYNSHRALEAALGILPASRGPHERKGHG